MKNLLIIGAGQYGMVAKEIAESMKCFEKMNKKLITRKARYRCQLRS